MFTSELRTPGATTNRTNNRPQRLLALNVHGLFLARSFKIEKIASQSHIAF